MKDSYSFDIDDAGLEASYQAHREAYVRIFDRLGFEYVIVQADSGAMGGSASEEFLAVAETGEDTFVRSPGGYAANVEAVTTVVPEPLPYDDVPAAHAEQTPETPTIETLVEPPERRVPARRPRVEAADTLKNVLVILRHPDGTREPLAIGLPGDRDVDLQAPRGAGRAGRGRRRSPTTTSTPTPTWQGLHRARARWGRSRPPASATSSTPGSSPAPAG